MSSSLLLLPLLLAHADRRLPEVELADFTGTEARALEDHLGQVLLLDFFAHWCAPCARLVPHVNELQQDFGALGLNVLGVTGDEHATAEEWLKRSGAQYPFARDPALRLQIELGFRPLPTAVLVDAYGLITWQGNPAELPVEVLETCLEGALERPAHRWPAEAGQVRAALRAGRLDEALQAARALKDGAALAAYVERFRERRLAYMEDAYARQDFLEAAEQAAWLAAGLASAPAKERIDALMARLTAAPEASKILAAQRELRERWSRVGTVANAKEADAMAEEIRALASAHPGTQVERSAKLHLETLVALKTLLP